jgi:flagellar motor switch protein FliN/FliY
MTAASLNREMFAALIEELGIVVGAMIDSPATVVPGAPAMGRQWVAQVRAEGELTGAITVVVDHDGAIAITSLMTGIEGAIPDEALLDTLREVLAQAVGALALKPVARGAKLAVAEVVASESRVPEGEWFAYGIGAEKMPASLAVTVWGSLSAGQPAAAMTAAAPRSVAQPAQAAAKAAVSTEATFDDRIDVILDIDLPLVVRFGKTELPLRALTRLGPGSVIDLGRSPDDPVEVLVSNRVVARGEVVIVSGSYGIRILDVVSQRERVRSMEA